MAKPNGVEEKPWVPKIRALKNALRMNQTQMAAELKVNQSTVSDWETGNYEPSADAYVRLAKLASGVAQTEPLWFCEQAGLTEEVLAALIPEFAKLLREADIDQKKIRTHTARNTAFIPLLRTPRYIGHRSIPSKEIEAMLPFPSQSVPNPSSTSCLKFASKTHLETIYAIDSATVRRDELWENVIAVLRPGEGASEASIGWMRPASEVLCRNIGLKPPVPLFSELPPENLIQKEKSDSWERLMEDSVLTRRTLLMLPNENWKILGRVVAMLTSFPRPRGEDQK